jgi:hypothetical protein
MEHDNSKVVNSKVRKGSKIGFRLNLISRNNSIHLNLSRYTGVFTGSRPL